MKSLFSPQVYDEIRHRINKLSENSEKEWGKMTPAQMLHHCQAPLNIMLQKNDYGLKPNFFAKLLFKKMLYNDTQYKKNMPTANVMREKEPRDFKLEKTNLISLLEEFENQKEREQWEPHPSFGYFTKEQWGMMQYKHLDHHLRQFKL